MPDCKILPPSGLPVVGNRHILPDDVRQFYILCGGITLFESADYSIQIVLPSKVVLANPVIVGESGENDISSSWYIIAKTLDTEYLTIDFDKGRSGRCYDSFFDSHAIVGSSAIVASTFTNLLELLVKNRGQHWYWLEPSFDTRDAYD